MPPAEGQAGNAEGDVPHLVAAYGDHGDKEHCLTDQCEGLEMAINRKGRYLLGAFFFKTKCLGIFHNWQYVRTDIARFKYCKRCYKREKELPAP